MPLFKRLKENNLVEDKKDYHNLIYNRQIVVNDKFVDDPKHQLEPTKKYSIKIGILEIEL